MLYLINENKVKETTTTKKNTHTYLIFECICTGKKEKQEIILFIDKFGLYHFFFILSICVMTPATLSAGRAFCFKEGIHVIC